MGEVYFKCPSQLQPTVLSLFTFIWTLYAILYPSLHLFLTLPTIFLSFHSVQSAVPVGFRLFELELITNKWSES